MSEPVPESVIALLEQIAEDPAVFSTLDREERRRIMTAAGRIARPDPTVRKKRVKALRKHKKKTRRDADQALLDRTGNRVARAAPLFLTPPPLEHAETTPEELEQPRLIDPKNCYVCKQDFHTVHHFYDQMCPECAEFNWEKRSQTADLTGRTALVTGARVKIGFHAAIKLLRAGARVLVCTRFPKDAAQRYAREPDFEDFRRRLQIFGLDLRHTPSVEQFCAQVLETELRLDFILNNACQTVRRPPGFYGHLIGGERADASVLPPEVASVLSSFESHRTLVRTKPLPENGAHGDSGAASAELSLVPLLPGDLDAGNEIFPRGELDADLQQVDLRGINSWRLTLEQVSAVELLEVHLVNAVAPFILNARLKSLMARGEERDKHIVNVSAMEGQFYRRFKTDKHPHTNMAKAALNMMTRTSAADYLKSGIHMNAVDTGWITDEDPAAIAERKKEEHRFHPPLDSVDGAARICDPIFHGFNTGEHASGKFYKDYEPTDW